MLVGGSVAGRGQCDTSYDVVLWSSWDTPTNTLVKGVGVEVEVVVILQRDLMAAVYLLNSQSRNGFFSSDKL